METTFLTINDIRDICFALAQEFLTFDEPIPGFETRFPGKLEAILEIPQQGTQEGLLYPTLTKQAAVLFYSLTKEHPVLNGNKRLAVVSLLTFLYLNKHWMETDWKTLYGLTIFVANSDPRDRDNVLKTLEEFISNSLAPR
jgi:death-on-curing protein